jgi:hypothetical protein
VKRTSCTACGRYFSSTAEFDAHRVGAYGKTPTARRCLTEVEMVDKWVHSPEVITDEAGRPTREVYQRVATWLAHGQKRRRMSERRQKA